MALHGADKKQMQQSYKQRKIPKKTYDEGSFSSAALYRQQILQELRTTEAQWIAAYSQMYFVQYPAPEKKQKSDIR